jgi:transcription-repair coupling factor (superfamily II helicase)
LRSPETVDRDIKRLRRIVRDDVPTIILCDNEGQAERLDELLNEDARDPSPAALVVGALGGGFVLPPADRERGLRVLTDHEIFRRERRIRRARRYVSGGVDSLALKPGDFVVHLEHGVGIYRGIETIFVGQSTIEVAVVEYEGGDRLNVPLYRIDQLERYRSSDDVSDDAPPPRLHKLGGKRWAQQRDRTRTAIQEMTLELLDLYARRKVASRPPHVPDTPWQKQLESSFLFEDTPDQRKATAEVKGDMESTRPMDRLLVGDVGYGKTEIAVRAAFKAVQDGKQVVVLVPTTLLAQQHLNTFTERMASFPVTVKGLSRFTHGPDADAVIEGLAAGEVDVVIGTHRLLQTGIRYKDLGLVIVDEEQRFGVEHKEHIKALRTHVDVLTMSATPIPRTLEMSLAGIREMSTILTPPEDRHPILTYVGAYDDKQVGAAIRRELLRDGQVFYVHNRVSSIEKAARRIRELVPEARVVTAHGQMNEDRLEKIIEGFWTREFDVLVCTTIVETGLDIANANTLIVERGDLLGLAQLHQLRGRVGRGRERGYAYFLYPPEAPLTETAHDRLATIAQNTELGAGMAVAMKDLEIRGAGNILGAEQSGHIAGVGFDLYVRLVGEAVEAFRKHAGAEPGEEEEELAEVRVDLPVDAHIPHDYVPGERLRLEAYRKIAAAVDADALTAVEEELKDRYGNPPLPVQRLFAVAAFRQKCREHGVTEVTLQGSSIRFAPLALRDSQIVRLKRLHPKANYKPVSELVTVPRPTEGAAGGRIGAPPLRDVELLDWCAKLLDGLVIAPAPVG